MIADDLAQLSQQHPRWRIEATWVTANSGPDARLLTARMGSHTLTATTAADLTRQIEQAERDRDRDRSWPSATLRLVLA